MITSKQIIKLCEEYVTSGKVRNHPVDIFENPTSSDILKLVKSAKDDQRTINNIRFIADANEKKVYIADAYYAIHDDMYRIIGITTKHDEAPWIFDGLATVFRGKIKAACWGDKFEFLFRNKGVKGSKVRSWFDKMFSCKWSFVDTYISGTSSMIADYQKKYLKILGEK